MKTIKENNIELLHHIIIRMITTQTIKYQHNKQKGKVGRIQIVKKDPELVKQLEYFRKLLSGLKRPEQMTARERMMMSK